MFDKESIKNMNTLFYTSFGKYMGKNRSIKGNKVKWINYNTGIKHVYVRLEVNRHSACISIYLQHKDEEIRELFYEQFISLKAVFHSIMKQEWIWQIKHYNKTGHQQCRIYLEQKDINIHDKSTWKKAFKFYEYHLLKFDEFWLESKDLFLQLQ